MAPPSDRPRAPSPPPNVVPGTISVGAKLSLLTEASPLLLASASPRRREMLSLLGIPTLVSRIDVDEAVLPNEPADAYLVRIVLAKLAGAAKPFAKPVLLKGGDTLKSVSLASTAGAILVADTSVIDGATILGKPTSPAEAEAMIARLAGRTHEVWTRFAIGAPESPARAIHEETVRTRVTFRPLSADQVKAYVASGEGNDKAGAYAVQGRGAALVTRIEGSYSNVVGLPACEVVLSLERLGLWS